MCDRDSFCNLASSGVVSAVGPQAANPSPFGFSTGRKGIESGTRYAEEILQAHLEVYTGLIESGKVILKDGHAQFPYE